MIYVCYMNVCGVWYMNVPCTLGRVRSEWMTSQSTPGVEIRASTAEENRSVGRYLSRDASYPTRFDAEKMRYLKKNYRFYGWKKKRIFFRILICTIKLIIMCYKSEEFVCLVLFTAVLILNINVLFNSIL